MIAEQLWRIIRAPRAESGALLFARFARRSTREYPDWTSPSLCERLREQILFLTADDHAPVVVPLGAGVYLFSFAGDFASLQLHLLREHLTTTLSQWAATQSDLTLIEVAQTYRWQEQSTSLLEEEREDAHLQDLMWVLSDSRLYPVFQPIVSLRDGGVAGWEALCRAHASSPLAMPSMLFSCAARLGMLTEIDAVCQERVLNGAQSLAHRGRIFVNIYPDSLLVRPFHESPLVLGAERLGIPPSRIVIEITERQAIHDFDRFVRILAAYREAGFRVAVDDAGAGYSSLQSIAEIAPDYVKIDRSLVQGIDSSANKRALLSVIVQFATRIGTCLIAEGIEKAEELSTLTELGIELGQGYFLARPAEQAPEPAPMTIQQIASAYEHHRSALIGRGRTIGDMVHHLEPLSVSERTLAVREQFQDMRDNDGRVVVDGEGRPVGLLMKRGLLAKLAMPYGHELLLRKTIDFIMDPSPMVVSEEITVDQVAHRILARDPDKLDDHVIVVRDFRYIGIVPARRVLETVARIQVNQAKYANSLSGLPGNVPLETELNLRLAAKTPFVVLCLDLDHFKFYNDRYGIANGDQVILTLAQILRQAAEQHDPALTLSHPGGDDFVVLAEESQAQTVATTVLERFTSRIPSFYTKEDNERGLIDGADREAAPTAFPLLSLTVAGVVVRADDNADYRKIMEHLGRLKLRLKRAGGTMFQIEEFAHPDA